jgi:hypothetical protein
MREVGTLIAGALGDMTSEDVLAAVRRRAGELTARFPLYGWKVGQGPRP